MGGRTPTDGATAPLFFEGEFAKKEERQMSTRFFMIGWLTLALLSAGACDSDEGAASERWECDEAHADWERCHGGVIEWCHVLDGSEPHFHHSTDCHALGLECFEPESGAAFCFDPEYACTTGEFRCGEAGSAEHNTAFNCVDGHWTIDPCGTAGECHEEEDRAHCERAGHDHHHDDHHHDDHHHDDH